MTFFYELFCSLFFMRHRLPLFSALLKVISGLALAGYGTYELRRNEYLYLNYGHHLA